MRYDASDMTHEERRTRIRAIVDEHRATCLWYLREDFYPETDEETVLVLDAIARHGDVRAFQQAEALRRWISLPSSSPSAG